MAPSQFVSNCTIDALKVAANLLKNGSLVAFPTETVYGLGADAQNEAAVARIYEVKGRPADHPLIVHIADWQQISITTQRADPNSSLNLLRAGGAISITETKGIQALLIKLVGLVPTEDATFFDPQKLPSDRLDVVARNANGNTNVEALNWVARLYDPYYRLTSFGGYIDYNNATNTMIDVYKGGTWEYNPATKSWDLNSDRIA